jgi:Carboxypeptidase regulatory-like domain
MLRPTRSRWRRHVLTAAAVLLAVATTSSFVPRALAMITGGEGNAPLADPGWPKGAAALFNHKGRIAWWEGPPFGGGQWHAECRGDASAFNAVLAAFARLDVKTRRLVVHDGVGASFWLNLNHEPAKRAAARMDWVFIVWQPDRWEFLRKLPADLNPIDARGADQGPPAQIDVFTGGSLRWSDVTVPAGLKVIDERLETHGFTPADGIVLEGKVVNLATRQSLAARVRLERIEPSKGGYHYALVAETVADAQGRWVLKKTPAGWHRVVVEAPGFVSRIAGFIQSDDQPSWHVFDGELLPPAPVSGRVTDDAGQPLADVDVRFGNVASDAGGRYQSPHDYKFKTDADGRFHAGQVPAGRATIWVNRSGYCGPGLGLPITTPAGDVVLIMKKAARVHITVDFAGTARPAGYIVHVEPEGGEAVGKWSGSGNIDAKNQIAYQDVPPGRYVVKGQPNPSTPNQQTLPVTVDLDGGKTTEVTLHAR